MSEHTVSGAARTFNSFVPLTIGGRVAVVPLTRGERAIVDVADLPIISPHRWSTKGHAEERTWYAGAWIRGRNVLMHRLIIGVGKFTPLVDHRDGNGLNNTRANLVLSDPSRNNRNFHVSKGKSKFRGVAWHRTCRKWQASIKIAGKGHYLGLFAEEEDAARAYDRALIRLLGPGFKTNFSQPEEAP